MKIVMSGEELYLGAKDFVKVYYKDEFNEKSKKNLLIFYSFVCIGTIITGILLPEERTFLFLIGFMMLSLPIIILIAALIGGFVSKRRKNNITKVEFIFEDKIYCNSYMENGSVNKEQYRYEDSLKVIETENYFYLFFNKCAAIPLKKNNEINREEFIEFMIDKNIAVKEKR